MSVALFREIQDDLDQVYDLMLQELKSDQSFLDQLIAYLLQKRGKMIRPALVILAGKICGNVNSDVLALGAATEILHMATLIHDDIVDEAEIRRGLTTVNKVFSSQIAVLLGDFFYAKSLKILTKIPHHGLKLFSGIVSNLVQGEFLQFENSFKLDQGMDLYWRLINYKTAYFIANCCRLGALAGKSEPEQLEALTEYGRMLGMAFQICDDLLDFSLTTQKLGKSTYRDVSNGIYTLPVLHALSYSTQQKKLKEILRKDMLTKVDYQRLFKILQNAGSMEYAYQKAELLSERARQQLKIFPPSPEKEILESLTDFNLVRNF